VESGTDDGKLLVVRTSGFSETPGFHLLDTSGGGVKFDAIGYEWPGFARRKLPVSVPAPVRTKSGRALEAVFTPAADVTGKAPLVVFANGTQAVGGFEPETYFLATRGYAVMHTYFSGTRIEGQNTYRSFYDWNGRQYEELQNALAWATQRPDVDASRVCIVGRAAYGGYTALLAAARADTPFKCAASFQGLSNLVEPRRKAVNARLIANEKPTGVSEEQLLREAPSRRAAEFSIPVLLVESDTDTHSGRDFDGGREMAAALAAANKPHKLLLVKDFDEAYLRAQYAELEKFLATHLR
jgi:dipeptidyl aminopeptidase/acylaminoacyl peptidase